MTGNPIKITNKDPENVGEDIRAANRDSKREKDLKMANWPERT
ncbi:MULTISPECIES: hypothetical protein [unclassified Methanosarcina]|nr:MULTISPECIES: hypothetical protein [unclassified Methanosarcina]